MEEAELRAAIAARRHSAENLGFNANIGWSGMGATSNPNTVIDYSRIYTPQPSTTPPNHTSPFANNTLPNSTSTSDTRTPANDSMASWAWPQNTGTHQSTSPGINGVNSVQNNYAGVQGMASVPTLEGMPWSLLSSSNDVSTVWAMDPMMNSNTMSNGIDTSSPTKMATSNVDPMNDQSQSLGLGFDLDPMIGLSLTQSLNGLFPNLPNSPAVQHKHMGLGGAADSHKVNNLNLVHDIHPGVPPNNVSGVNVAVNTDHVSPLGGIQQNNVNKHPPSVITSFPSEAGKAIDAVLSHAAGFSQTVLEEKDISQSARDYL